MAWMVADLVAKEKEELSVRFYGKDPIDGAIDALPHLKSLLREVTKSVAGDPGAVEWRVRSLRMVCDGCERDRPEPHDWINDGMYDYCPPCARERFMGASF